MTLAIILGSVLAAAFSALGAAKLAKTPSMLARAAHVGFSSGSYQLIGAAELAGAAGVVAGLWVNPLGYAAAGGLLALLSGALLTHVRKGDRPADLAPAALFAVGTLVYLVALGTS